MLRFNLFCPREPVLPGTSLVMYDKTSPTEPYHEIKGHASVQQMLCPYNKTASSKSESFPRIALAYIGEISLFVLL